MQQVFLHKTLAPRWHTFTLAEQMANIGSEVSRSINWKKRDNKELSNSAFLRAIELFNLTILDLTKKKKFASMGEVCRAKEVYADYLIADNKYQETAEKLNKYFLQFNFLARSNH